MYQIKGKIDSTNAADFENELMAAKPSELDASQLEYISSAGLRVLLKLTKAVGDVTVNNVSSEVYEIFDVTGFTEILNVKKAFREIDLTGKEILGKGGNGTVYRLDAETIVNRISEKSVPKTGLYFCVNIVSIRQYSFSDITPSDSIFRARCIVV